MQKPAIEGGKPIRDKYLVFGFPKIGQEEIDEVIKVLKSGWIGTGPKAKQFEENCKKYIGSKHAIAVNSCTAALHLSLVCNGIGKGDEVITSPMSFGSTVNVIEHVNAKPIFVDIEDDSYNINPDKIEEAITPRTKAIIPIHFGGLPCDMEKIYNIGKKYNLSIIEDAAHAIGAEFNSKKIGSYGNPTCFSFYPTKNITCIEGGLICLNDDALADKIRSYSLHGLSKDAWQRFNMDSKKTYEVLYPGYKYNLPDVNASIGIVQLSKIEEIIKIRTEFAKLYLEAFEDCEYIEIPPMKKGRIHVWHLFSMLLVLEKLKISRNKFLEALHKENIGCGIHYKAIHTQPYYKNKYNIKKNIFKRSEYVSERTISIPIQVSMSEEDLFDVVKAIKRIINFYKK